MLRDLQAHFHSHPRLSYFKIGRPPLNSFIPLHKSLIPLFLLFIVSPLILSFRYSLFFILKCLHFSHLTLLRLSPFTSLGSWNYCNLARFFWSNNSEHPPSVEFYFYFSTFIFLTVLIFYLLYFLLFYCYFHSFYFLLSMHWAHNLMNFTFSVYVNKLQCYYLLSVQLYLTFFSV
jgi:hypothetical protein